MWRSLARWVRCSAAASRPPHLPGAVGTPDRSAPAAASVAIATLLPRGYTPLDCSLTVTARENVFLPPNRPVVHARPASTLPALVVRQMTVAELKARMVDAVSAPVERQRLIFRGRALVDTQTLAAVGLEEGDTLHLVVRAADLPLPPAQGASGAQQQQRQQQQQPHAMGNPMGMFGGVPGGAGGDFMIVSAAAARPAVCWRCSREEPCS